MAKPLVIFHKSCADGFGAAFAAWLKLGDEAEYLPMQYGDVPEVQDLRDMVDHRDVYVLDFSLPKPGMDELFRTAERVVWLDHHKTAFEMWGVPVDFRYECADVGDRHRTILDNNRSGALIAWEYFHPNTEVPMLIKHIDDYDRWQFKLQGTKEFNKALWSYASWSFEQWKDFFFCGPDDGEDNITPGEFIAQGAAILRAHNQNVQSVVKGGARKCEFGVQTAIVHDGYGGMEQEGFLASGLAANCPPHLTSDVGHELAKQSGTFGLCWTLSKEGMVAKCSLRSNGDYDVSAIAKAFGGGGHKAASGFEVPIETLLGWMK